MQNIEPDQVQLEHNAPQEPAPHTQEPLQYAPVASSDHDRRFQKVRSASTRWTSRACSLFPLRCSFRHYRVQHVDVAAPACLSKIGGPDWLTLCTITHVKLQASCNNCSTTAESAPYHCSANIQADSSFRVCTHSYARYDGWRLYNDKCRRHTELHC